VTAKGTKPGDVPRPSAVTSGPSTSGGGSKSSAMSSRYTPPTPKSVKVSPPWVPFVMFALLIVGGLMIMLNYIGLLPGAQSNWYLLGGLAFILAGIITATQYR
jgi:hypothetical protein